MKRNSLIVRKGQKLHHLKFRLELRGTQWTKGGKYVGEVEKQITGQKNHPQRDMSRAYQAEMDET